MSNGKFSTTSSSLFTNKNEQKIPEWIENLSNNIDIKEKQTIDLGIQAKGVFAEKQTVNRDLIDGTPRTMEAGLSDTRLITDAKINLAKFLTGKYYKVEGKVHGNTVKLDVKIDAVPAEFTFGFSAEGAKISNDDIFSVLSNGEYGEYPFSKAGFEECINDIRANRVKMGSKKVEAIGKACIINREEIFRRYNGHIREATDRINELVSEGSLIGVGSNTYASIYDLDYLFPQMEKEACEAPLGAFEFAPNTEHVATNEFKSAEVLTIEADKLISEFFTDYKVINSARDNSELLLKTDVLHNGIIYRIDMSLGIENEKLASFKVLEHNDERMTLEQFLDKININNKLVESYLANNSSAKRIYRGTVLERRTILNRLTKIVRNDVIDDIIENWVDRKLMTKINSTTFCTTNSFEQLLASINTKVLTAEEKEQINILSNRVAMYETERQDVQDTGVRDYDNVEVSTEIRLSNLKNHITKYFKNFKIANLNGEKAEMVFVDTNTGLENRISVAIDFNVNEIKHVVANVNNKTFALNKVSEMFSKSPVLAAYLQDNKANIVEGSIIITERNLRNKLAAFVDTDKIDSIIDSWYNDKLIVNTGNGTYISDYKLEELLNKSGIEILSEEERKQIAIAKAYFGEGLNLTRQAVEDTGVREPDEYVNDDTMLLKANEFIAQHFKSFKPEGFKINNENVSYNVGLFDENTGLTTNINFNMAFDGNKVASCYANINGNKIDIKNIKKAFASNDTLNKYLETNPGKRTNAPMLMSVAKLIKKLSNVSNASISEVQDTIKSWENAGKINKLASNIFASKYTLEQLIVESELKALDDSEVKDQLELSMRNHNMITSSYIQDSDTRALIEKWSAEKMVLHAKTELNKLFKSYDILNAVIDNDSYVVTARVINPLNGTRQKFKFKFAMVNDKPANLLTVADNEKVVSAENINELSKNSEALDIFIKRANAVDRQNKYIVTKLQLNNLLGSVIDTTKIDEICDALIAYDVLKPITNETFASDYSASEIVENLNTLNLVDIEKGNEQTNVAKRDDNLIKISDSRIMNTDTRILEANKSLSPQMIQLRDKIKVAAEKASKQKIITSNKLNQISTMLNEAKNEKDLENTWKELKKYFK